MHPSNRVTLDDVEDVFNYHAETWKILYYDSIRKSAKSMARTILENCPDCADRTSAIRKLREAMMTANAAIALAHEPWDI